MRVLEVNLVGTFLVSREALRIEKLKTIINISSTESIDTYNDLSIDYCASKSGVNMLTKILAMKYPNIKICALAPNWVNTDSVMEMYPKYLEDELKRIGQKRLLTVEEVASKIYSMVDDINIKSGDIVRLDCEE
jgi:NAD(P)-dependent dehydrogenase (short-subunit alcohol dehydrogenase family)